MAYNHDSKIQQKIYIYKNFLCMSPLVTCMALNKLELKRVNYFLRKFDLIYPPFFWKVQMSKMLTSKKLVIFQKLTKFKERI